ncbi:MAG: zinc ribbon domain-containing protein [Saccharofermentans sp.]|nr:zinc ribbon domain-containing protein [Saccharofermentans sp.]
MSLINCPECGGKVSDQAGVCVHCGYVLNEAKAKAIGGVGASEETKPQAAASSGLDFLDTKFNHPKFLTFDRSFLFGGIGSILIFSAVFMPFIALGLIELSLSQGQDGIIFIIVAIAGLLFSALANLPGVITLGLTSIIMTILSIFETVNISSKPADSGLFKDAAYTPQIGFFIIILGTILLIIATVFKIKRFIKSKKG